MKQEFPPKGAQGEGVMDDLTWSWKDGWDTE